MRAAATAGGAYRRKEGRVSRLLAIALAGVIAAAIAGGVVGCARNGLGSYDWPHVFTR